MMKRGLESESVEFEGVGLAEDEVVSATIHGVLKEFSPIKKSGNSASSYYNGVLTGGEKMRLVGFDCDSHAKLSGCCSSKEAVMIKKCQIKKARQSNDLELFSLYTLTIPWHILLLWKFFITSLFHSFSRISMSFRSSLTFACSPVHFHSAFVVSSSLCLFP